MGNYIYPLSSCIPADSPSGGGGGEWKLIRTVTIPEDITTDTSGVNFAEQANGGILFGFDTDENGEAFSYKTIILTANFGGVQETSRADSLCIRNSAIPSFSVGNTDIAFLGTTIHKNGYKLEYWGGFTLIPKKYILVLYANTYNPINVPAGTTSRAISCSYDSFKALSMFISGQKNYGFSVGSTFTFYGR